MEVSPTPEDLAADQEDALDLPRAIIDRAIARFHETEAIHRRNNKLTAIDPRAEPWGEMEYLVTSAARSHLLRVVLATDPTAGINLTPIEFHDRPARVIVVDGTAYAALPDPHADARQKPGGPQRMYLAVFPAESIRHLGGINSAEVLIESVAHYDRAVVASEGECDPRLSGLLEEHPKLLELVGDLVRTVGVDEVRRRLLWNLPDYRESAPAST